MNYLICLTPSTGRYSSPVNSSYIIAGKPVSNIVCKAFKVMSNGWGISGTEKKLPYKSNLKQAKYTIHPELLDKSGNITEEELLTVRFSNDNDSTLEEKGSKTD